MLVMQVYWCRISVHVQCLKNIVYKIVERERRKGRGREGKGRGGGGKRGGEGGERGDKCCIQSFEVQQAVI